MFGIWLYRVIVVDTKLSNVVSYLKKADFKYIRHKYHKMNLIRLSLSAWWPISQHQLNPQIYELLIQHIFRPLLGPSQSGLFSFGQISYSRSFSHWNVSILTPDSTFLYSWVVPFGSTQIFKEMTPIFVKLDSLSTACMPDLEHAD